MTGKPKGPAGALAAVLGGAVTRERLQRAAAREGRTDAALVRTLLAQALPTVEDLARAYREVGGSLRLDPSFLRMAPRAALQSFQAYLQENPKGSLAEEAEWGATLALGKLGRKADEIKALRQFMSQFPQSPYARLASERLKALE